MTVGLGGSIPQLNRSGQTPGTKPLFHSVRDIALIIDKTCKAGYGYLRAGTIMCINTADEDLVPYPEADEDVNVGNAKAYLTVDSGSANATVEVTNEESYKFAVGDSLILNDDTTTAEDLGAIVSIVPGTNGIAVITVTDDIGATSFTTARDAYVTCKSDTSAGFTKAAYILDQDVNTGIGEDALGAITSVVISNAVLYSASMVNSDSAARTDLGTVSDGRFLILK